MYYLSILPICSRAILAGGVVFGAIALATPAQAFESEEECLGEVRAVEQSLLKAEVSDDQLAQIAGELEAARTACASDPQAAETLLTQTADNLEEMSGG